MVAALVPAVATVVYTIGTLLLWRVTRDALKLTLMAALYPPEPHSTRTSFVSLLLGQHRRERFRRVFPKEFEEVPQNARRSGDERQGGKRQGSNTTLLVGRGGDYILARLGP